MRLEFNNNAEGRRTLRSAMKGRKVFVDEMPFSQKAALKLLADGMTLYQVWSDATGLKLGVLWEGSKE